MKSEETKISSVLGINISDTSIEACELNFSKGAIRVESISRITFNDGIFKDGLLQDAVSFQSLLFKLLTSAKPKRFQSNKVVLSLSRNAVNSFSKEVPINIDQDQLQQLIKGESAAIFKDTPPEIYEYSELFPSGRTQRLYAAFINKKNLDLIIQEIRSAGFEVLGVEEEGIGIPRAVFEDPGTGKVSLFVDMGAKDTVLTIFDSQGVGLMRTLPLGGFAITELIASNLGISVKEAEVIKQDYGIAKSDYKSKIEKPIVGLIDRMIQRVNDTMGEYKKTIGRAVDTIYLSGGVALMKGLPEYLAAKIRVKDISLARTWVNSKVLKEDDLVFYLGSIGLALKGLNYNGSLQKLNLLASIEQILPVEDVEQPKVLDKIKRFFISDSKKEKKKNIPKPIVVKSEPVPVDEKEKLVQPQVPSNEQSEKETPSVKEFPTAPSLLERQIKQKSESEKKKIGIGEEVSKQKEVPITPTDKDKKKLEPTLTAKAKPTKFDKSISPKPEKEKVSKFAQFFGFKTTEKKEKKKEPIKKGEKPLVKKRKYQSQMEEKAFKLQEQINKNKASTAKTSSLSGMGIINWRKIIPFILLPVILGGVGYGIYLFLKNRKPSNQDQVVEGRLEFSFSETESIDLDDEESVMFMAEVYEQEIKKAMDFEATGKGSSSDILEGTVIITNDSYTTFNLVATTRLITADGRLYRLKDQTNVPLKASVEAVVTASGTGASYEITTETKLTFPGLAEDLMDIIYAYPKSEIVSSGGIGVSGEDLTKAEEKLKDLIDEIAFKDLDLEPTKGKIFADHFISLEMKSITFDASEGDSVQKFNGTIVFGVYVLQLDEEQIVSYVIERIPDHIQEGENASDFLIQSLEVKIESYENNTVTITIKPNLQKM